jgi:hypothetical protein
MGFDNASTNVQAKSRSWTPAKITTLRPCNRLTWTFYCGTPHRGESAEAREQFSLSFLGDTRASIYYAYLDLWCLIVGWIKKWLGFQANSIAFRSIAESITK